jgi:hypothetical protein
VLVLPARAEVAAASRRAKVDVSFIRKAKFNATLTYITGAAIATIQFARRLPIRTKTFVSFGAPKNAAGELVILLAKGLVIHLLAAQVPARKLKLARRLGVVHGFPFTRFVQQRQARRV